jgi:hypothetical protein
VLSRFNHVPCQPMLTFRKCLSCLILYNVYSITTATMQLRQAHVVPAVPRPPLHMELPLQRPPLHSSSPPTKAPTKTLHSPTTLPHSLLLRSSPSKTLPSTTLSAKSSTKRCCTALLLSLLPSRASLLSVLAVLAWRLCARWCSPPSKASGLRGEAGERGEAGAAEWVERE